MNSWIGFFVGFSIPFIWLGCLLLLFGVLRWVLDDRFLKEFTPSHISKIIGYFLLFAPLFYLWHNGNTTWEQYGDLDLVVAFFSLLMWPWEVASGLENLLELETGTLGGFPIN